MLQKTKHFVRFALLDRVFPSSSSEPFALGYIDINFLYAAPVCRLCVCESACAPVGETIRVFIAAAAVN